MSDPAPGNRSRRGAHSPAPEPLGHGKVMAILGSLLLGMFLAALDQTVVSTAIRTIADDLQGYSEQAWATTAFLITATISTPLYGKLSDMYGRRPFYLFAIAVFVIGSLLCGTSESMYQLAAYRALEGIGAGGLISLALAIIGDIIPPRERSRYQGYFMAVFGGASVLGPVVGGFLSGQTTILGLDGWRWIFWINVPIGVVAFVLVARTLHLPHHRQDARIDYPGAVALSIFLVPVLIVAEQGRDWGWGSSSSILCYVVGAVGLVLFVLAERAYGDDAILPLRLFRIRSFSVVAIGSLVIGAGMFGGLLLLPQWLQVVHGSSPTVAGLQMTPLVLGIAVASMASGVVISRTGHYKVFPLVGVAIMAVALGALSAVLEAGTSIWTLAPYMLLLGLGLGCVFQPVVLAVQSAVSPREMGVATSSATFFRQMGGTLGTAAFLSILFGRLPGDLESSIAGAVRSNPQAAEQAAALERAGTASLTSNTSAIERYPLLVRPFREGFADSLDTVFLIAAVVVAIGFVVFLFLPELPLADKAGIEAREEEVEEAEAEAEGLVVPELDDAAGQAVHAVARSAPSSVPPPVGTPSGATRWE